LIRETNGKANISYGDSYEEALKKASKYAEEVAEEAKKDAYKDELKKALRDLGKSTSGLSRNELEKKLKKYNKEALAEAKKVSDLEYRIKLKSLNSGGSGDSDNDDKEINAAYAEADKLRKQLLEQKIDWGYAWGRMKDRFPQASTEFIDKALGVDVRGY
jgi:cysteinyl-tRNA synthetase